MAQTKAKPTRSARTTARSSMTPTRSTRSARTAKGRAPVRRTTTKKVTAAARKPSTDGTLSPKEVVRKIEAAWNAGRLDQLDRYFAKTFRSESAIPMLPPGLEGAKIAHQMSMQAMPDRKFKVMDTVQDGNKVAVRCRMTGTNTGGMPWFGAPANGAKVEADWISIYEVRNGMATRHWAVNDGIAILTQLGVWQMPAM